MIKFEIITLFPNLFKEHLNTYPLKKAIANKLIEVNLHNLREFAVDKHGTVDDKPYGGGVGMILMAQPVFEAVEKLGMAKGKNREKIVVLSPAGRTYNQNIAKELVSLKKIALICGRYEGIDQRVFDGLADDVISIGDFIVSGGEVPAMIVLESITRLIPGVLEKEGATERESFTNGYLEHPQYTRPGEYKGMKVPEVLLSGNHREIEEWKKANSKDLSYKALTS